MAVLIRRSRLCVDWGSSSASAVRSPLASVQLPGGTFNGYDAYVALMQRCWAEDPAERPTFEQASRAIRRG